MRRFLFFSREPGERVPSWLRCVPQLCAKGARTRYNGWEDGARGVEIAGEWANARVAVRGRAGDELCHRSERGGEQRENAPAVGKSARARSIINRRGACAAGRRRETVARSRALSPTQRVAVRCALFRRRERVAFVVQARCRLVTVLAFLRFLLIACRERPCFAKSQCPPPCAPRRYRARGATVLRLSRGRFLRAAPFFARRSRVFAVGC